ncbi:MAG: hypothetical protein P8R54_17580 [Myxococcota bacterium]|nr:hypothetical protein [Myxococcota bacterium]
MFLDTLSLSERKSFLALAIHLVHSDGEFDQTEEQRLRALRREMALPADTELPDDPLDALPVPFSSRESCTKVVLALLELAYVDGVFDRRERAMIKVIGTRFSMSTDELNRLEDWTIRLSQLMSEAKGLWSD